MPAGYLFLLDSEESLRFCISNGVYATRLPNGILKNNTWGTPVEATFGDYATMKEGDNVYFFIKRKIYGIGELINIGDECKFLNYPSANEPITFNYSDIKESLLIDAGTESTYQRFLCTFRPFPAFFNNGIDMDDVLNSNPDKFKMLRALQQVSFIKFDDEENQSFKNIILKYNQDLLSDGGDAVFPANHEALHSSIQERICTADYNLNYYPLVECCADEEYISHEMALEVGLLSQLSSNDEGTTSVFGVWDYLSHQVVASPFKPIHYMDKMDIFGYSYIPGYAPTKSKFLIIEAKRGNASEADVLQLMKYVDWVNSEYCHSDYSMIHAFLVAYSYDEGLHEELESLIERNYIIGVKPSRAQRWANLHLVKYSLNREIRKIEFSSSAIS